MANSNKFRIRVSAVRSGQDLQTSSPSSCAPAADLNREQIEAWAQLVADGRDSFPVGLHPRQEEEMLQQVRRLRRSRLVHFIARQVAIDIHRDTAGQHGGKHVEATN